MLRECNLKPEDWVRRVAGILAAQDGLYAGAKVRTAAVLDKESKAWRNALTIVELGDANLKADRCDVHRYREVQLLEEWLDLKGWLSILGDIAEGKHRIADTDVTYRTAGFTTCEFLPRLNFYSSYAGWLFEAGRSGTPQVTDEPLLAPNQPFYSNGYQALEHWCGIKGLSMSDGRVGGAYVMFPELRAGINKVFLDDDGLLRFELFSVRGIPLEKQLELKGSWSVGDQRIPLYARFSRDLRLPVPEDAKAFAAYLTAGDMVFDYHDESGYYPSGGGRVLTGVPSGDLGQVVQRALHTGESNTVEFKPFVEKDHAKAAELVRTIIAFANTGGGLLLLGVDNHCVVVGIEKELFERGATLDASMERYKGWLKRLMGDNLNRLPEFDLEYLTIKGHKVLALRIHEGTEKPYARILTNEIWIRRGGNNFTPDPDTELPDLLRPKGSEFSPLNLLPPLRRRH
jgi:hypothetical protein